MLRKSISVKGENACRDKEIYVATVSETEKHEKLVATNLCHDTRHPYRDKNKTDASKLCHDIV